MTSYLFTLPANWSDELSPELIGHALRILFVIAGAFILNKVASRFIERAVRIAVVSDHFLSKESEIKREDTLIRIFNWTSRIVILVIALMMILQELGVPIGPVLAGAGVIGLAVGFGGQYLIRDIISGFFIILENQYRIGDVVRFGDTSGLVEDISLRMTTLRDLDGTVHHVPHGEIKTVSNLSKYFARVNLNVGVSYASNLEEVIAVINAVGSELAEDPEWKDRIIKAPQFLRVDEFADSAILIKILGETQALKQWEVTGELRKRLKIAFDRKGIEIPFPQRVVHAPREN
jgi:small-conductance mechanosensitive channel